jgi:hypothetical protein
VVEEHLVSCADCHEFFPYFKAAWRKLGGEESGSFLRFSIPRLSAKVDQTKSQVHSDGWYGLYSQLSSEFSYSPEFTPESGSAHRLKTTEGLPVPKIRWWQHSNDFEAETIESFLVTEP